MGWGSQSISRTSEFPWTKEASQSAQSSSTSLSETEGDVIAIVSEKNSTTSEKLKKDIKKFSSEKEKKNLSEDVRTSCESIHTVNEVHDVDGSDDDDDKVENAGKSDDARDVQNCDENGVVANFNFD